MEPASGGTSQGIRNTIPALQDLGIANEVVCLDAPGSAYLQQDNFKIHAIGPFKGPWQYAASLLPWLLQNLQRFDVVIINGLWLYHGFAVAKAVRQMQSQNKEVPKVLVMPHGMLDPYFQKAESRKLKAIRNQLYWKLVEHKVINRADGLLFTCASEMELARQPFNPYHPKREFNIGYGIMPPPGFHPAMEQAFRSRVTALGESSYLLFLSRIHEKKGVDLLIKSYAFLFSEMDSMDKIKLPKLVIAGPGLETDYGIQMLDLVKSVPGLSDYVFFPGMLSGDSKWGAFYGCKAFVLPSHQENFGIAVVEALACGKPVLISNQVNIYKEIEEGGAGLVEADSLAGIVKLLKNFFELPARGLNDMQKAAYACYKEQFSIEKTSLLFAKTIKGLINNSNT